MENTFRTCLQGSVCAYGRWPALSPAWGRQRLCGYPRGARKPRHRGLLRISCPADGVWTTRALESTWTHATPLVSCGLERLSAGQEQLARPHLLRHSSCAGRFAACGSRPARTWSTTRTAHEWQSGGRAAHSGPHGKRCRLCSARACLWPFSSSVSHRATGQGRPQRDFEPAKQ